MLSTALEHYRQQQRISAAGLIAARRVRKLGPLEVAKIVAAFQLMAARDAVAAFPKMLDEQGITDDPVGEVVPLALVGTASDGRPLDTLFGQAQTDFQFGLMVATQLQDAARGAAAVSMGARNRVGYVRMLNPPSCSRCAILAGKWYGWNAGFQRHPKCDCRHVPTTENVAGDLTTNPDAYFRSLPTAADLDAKHPDLTVKMRREAGIYSREDIFGKAGSLAIEDGADISQVVNARRGMQKAQLFGRDAYTTTEGITKRGLYGSSSFAAGQGYTGRNVGQRGAVKNYIERSANRARLMPETIYAIAEDRADAQRLLRLYGYVT